MILGTLLNLSERLVLVYKTVLSTTSPKGRYKDSDVTSVRCFLWRTVVVARRVNIPSLLKDSQVGRGPAQWGGAGAHGSLGCHGQGFGKPGAQGLCGRRPPGQRRVGLGRSARAARGVSVCWDRAGRGS